MRNFYALILIIDKRHKLVCKAIYIYKILNTFYHFPIDMNFNAPILIHIARVGCCEMSLTDEFYSVQCFGKFIELISNVGH